MSSLRKLSILPDGLTRHLAVPAAFVLTLAAGHALAATPSLAPAATFQAEGTKKVPVGTKKVPTKRVQPAKGQTPATKKPVNGTGKVQPGHEGHDHAPGQHPADKKVPVGKQYPAGKAIPGKGLPTKGANGKSLGRYGNQINPDAKLTVEFGTEKHDFGSIRQGNRANHTFTMASSGKADLVIYQAKPTCGCTVGELLVQDEKGEMVPYKLGEAIPPGTRIDIAASIDTSNKSNKTQVRINVYTNDPSGLTQFSLLANVQPFMTVSPRALMFGDVAEDTVTDDRINIRIASGEKVLLMVDDSNRIPVPQGLKLSLEAVDPDEDGRSGHWQVVAHLGPGLKEGPLGYQMRLKSDREIVNGKPNPDGTPRTHTTAVNVNARVLGVLTCAPQYLSMGLVRPGQVVGRSVTLISHDPDFELSDVKAQVVGYKGQELKWAEYFSYNVRPVPGRNAVQIELRLEGLPDKANGSFKGQVLIQTGNDKKPQVEVTFSGVCRAGVARKTPPPAGTRKIPGSKGK